MKRAMLAFAASTVVALGALGALAIGWSLLGDAPWEEAQSEEGQEEGATQEQYAHRFCQLVQANMTSIEEEIVRIQNEQPSSWSEVANAADYVRQRVRGFRQAISALTPPPGASDFHTTFVDDLWAMEALLNEYRTEAAKSIACDNLRQATPTTFRVTILLCTEEFQQITKTSLEAKATAMTRVFANLASHLPSADIYDLMNEDPYCPQGLGIEQ